MLEEREFFVRKAIGWVLRETGKLTTGRCKDVRWSFQPADDAHRT